MEATGRLLRALLDEAPSQEIDTAVRECLRSIEPLPEKAKAAAAAELDQMLELRELIDRYRRRSTELRALFETAGDLSSVREVEGVLQAIVRRGRQLLGADAAYLMLVDEERRDTYMRVTEGTTSPEFPNIRLPLGVGLGGRVAETMTPHWTSDYLRDTRYLHAIDGIVLDESLVAILGVPLKIGRRLLGVLFAADRSPREFSQDEVSLLASLGDHAAIAIENAALFQETREAVVAVEAANNTIEESNRRLQLAVDLHEQLMSLVLSGGSVQDLADVLAAVMGGAVLVIDERHRQLARATISTDAVLTDGLADITAQLDDEDMTGRSLRLEGKSSAAAVTPVMAGQQSHGYVIYVGHGITDVELRSLERAATTLALLLLNRRANDSADNRVRGELLGELLTPALRDADAILRRARLLDVDLTTELTVVVVVPEQAGSMNRTFHDECLQLARSHHGLASALVDRFVLLLPGADSAAIARSVAKHLADGGLRATVGSSGPIEELRSVVRHEDRARRAARLLLGLGETGEGVSADEIGIYGLLLSDVGEEHVRQFISTAMGEVERYDAARGTSLMETLEAYFSSDGNVGAAADALYVHANTMYQRLERLDRLLGAGWRTGERGLNLRLALRFRRILTGGDMGSST